MEKVGNITYLQAILPFTYRPDSASFQHGTFCVHLKTRSWLQCWLQTDSILESGFITSWGFWGYALLCDPHLQCGRVLWWERASCQHRGMCSAQKVLESRPLSPGSPGNRRRWMLTQEGLVAFMSAETLTAFGTQLQAPGAAQREAEEVGTQCGSPGKACPFCVVLSPGHSRSLGTGLLVPCDKPAPA